MEPSTKRQRGAGPPAHDDGGRELLGSEEPASQGPPVVILDGGYGLELKRRKSEGRRAAYSLQLFSTAALLETPEAVRELHDDYVAAGARVLTTATFAVSRQYLDKAGLGSKAGELARKAVRLAREAADAAQGGDGRSAGPVRVAGSVPPLAECYRTDLVRDDAAMESEYRELTGAMKGVDLWLCETMSSVEEARAAVAACQRADASLPVWLSFVLRRCPRAPGAVEIMDGTAVVEALRLARSLGVDALLFNCSTPQLIGEALEALRGESREGLLLGGYGNFWEEHKPGWSIDCQESESGKGDQKSCGLQVRDITPEDYAESARRWVAAGASIVGGCCGIGPPHIRTLADALAG